MSSENSPTSPRDNVVCIPTICLDSLNDSCDSSDQFYVASECETEQSFGINVSNFFLGYHTLDLRDAFWWLQYWCLSAIWVFVVHYICCILLR